MIFPSLSSLTTYSLSLIFLIVSAKFLNAGIKIDLKDERELDENNEPIQLLLYLVDQTYQHKILEF